MHHASQYPGLADNPVLVGHDEGSKESKMNERREESEHKVGTACLQRPALETALSTADVTATMTVRVVQRFRGGRGEQRTNPSRARRASGVDARHGLVRWGGVASAPPRDHSRLASSTSTPPLLQLFHCFASNTAHCCVIAGHLDQRYRPSVPVFLDCGTPSYACTVVKDGTRTLAGGHTKDSAL